MAHGQKISFATWRKRMMILFITITILNFSMDIGTTTALAIKYGDTFIIPNSEAYETNYVIREYIRDYGLVGIPFAFAYCIVWNGKKYWSVLILFFLSLNFFFFKRTEVKLSVAQGIMVLSGAFLAAGLNNLYILISA